MKRIFFMWPVILILLMTGCKTDEKDRTIKEERPDSKVADIIRNPVSAEGTIDTVNVPRITFEQEVYDFGEAIEGEIIKVDFAFTNTGKIPLLIADARATCGCTVPKWPKDPIDPGNSDIITVEFNTEGRKYDQKRPVSIIANTYPRQTDILIKGFVKPKS